MKRVNRILVACVYAVAVVGCRQAGSNSEAHMNNSSDNSAADSVTIMSNASPAEVSAVHDPCTDLHPPAKTLDVAGITIDMPGQEALQRINCNNKSLSAQFGSYTTPGFPYAQHPDGNRPRDFISTPGEGGTAPEEYFLRIAGSPGEERVVGITRVLRFRSGEEPTVQALASEIRSKYSLSVSQGSRALSWTPWSAARGAGTSHCMPPAIEAQADTNPMREYQLDCPFYIAAEIWPKRDNPALAGELRVVVADGARAAQLVNAYNAGAVTAANQRRQEEVQGAARRGTPRL